MEEPLGIPWVAPAAGPAASFMFLAQVRRQQPRLVMFRITSPHQLLGVWVSQEMFVKSKWNPP